VKEKNKTVVAKTGLQATAAAAEVERRERTESLIE
jgi:hypothetical protein